MEPARRRPERGARSVGTLVDGAGPVPPCPNSSLRAPPPPHPDDHTQKKSPEGDVVRGCQSVQSGVASRRRRDSSLDSMRGGLLQHHSRAASAFAVGRDAVSKGARGSGNNAAVLLGPSQLPLSRPTDLFSAELTPRTHMSKKKKGAPGTAPCPSTTPIYMLSAYYLGERMVPPTRLGPGSMRTPTRSHGSLGLLLPLPPTTLIPSCKG